jgi:hypothetical protein
MPLRLIIALIGILSIYLGYRLFCGRSVQRTLTNLASGALLALFGMGTLVADVRGYTAPGRLDQPEWQRKSSQHRSFERGNIRKPGNSVNRFI